MVGLVSMGIASLIGIFLGALAGFFGDNKLKMPRIKISFHTYWIIFWSFLWIWAQKVCVS